MSVQQPTPETQQDMLDEAKQVYHAAQQLLHTERLKMRGKVMLAEQEWQLSKRATMVSAGSMLLLSMVLMVCWLLVNSLIGLALYQLATPLWAVLISLLCLNILCAHLLWQWCRAAVGQVGFGRTWRSVFGESEHEDTHTRTH